MYNLLQDHAFLYDMYTKYSSHNKEIMWTGIFVGCMLEKQSPHLFYFVTEVGFISLDMWMLRITGTDLHKSPKLIY